MDASTALDPKTTAVLVMDYQKGVLGYVKDAAETFRRAAGVLAAVRAAGIPVYYIVVGFRKGYPEISPSNKNFSAIMATQKFVEGSEDTQVPEVVAPLASEPVIYKKRVSAFAGSDLEMVLRSRGVQTLVLMGVATSGVVLSTMRQAADLDFRLIVIKDCCADVDAEVHTVLTEKVFPRQGTVLGSEDFIRQHVSASGTV